MKSDISNGFRRMFASITLVVGMLVGLPLLGVAWYGLPVARFLEFPPRTQYVQHAPFSWVVFGGMALAVGLVLFSLVIRAIGALIAAGFSLPFARRFPWWGWLGLILGATNWVLAWTRFQWFETFQPHTFTPLWLAYILVINAVAFMQSGHCLMCRRPWFFLGLFPVSAVFWWFFEFLNRFVQNWYYTGVEYGPLQYVLLATPPFATVLPAVLSTRDWLRSTRWIVIGFRDCNPIVIQQPRLLALVALVTAGVGLLLVGVLPDYLFPLVWVAPMVMIAACQALRRERHVFSDLADGDWTLLVSSALAAVVCGFFWEMWNYYSYARWEYSVPFVQRFLIFEMPVLGYAGYLPFGLECTAAGMLLERWAGHKR